MTVLAATSPPDCGWGLLSRAEDFADPPFHILTVKNKKRHLTVLQYLSFRDASEYSAAFSVSEAFSEGCLLWWFGKLVPSWQRTDIKLIVVRSNSAQLDETSGRIIVIVVNIEATQF